MNGEASDDPNPTVKCSSVHRSIESTQRCQRQSEQQIVDNELAHKYDKLHQHDFLAEFISNPHRANLQRVGLRCFKEKLFDAARIVFQDIPNWGHLASTLLEVHLLREAVDTAKAADSNDVWMEVLHGCVEQGGHGLAQICGQHLVGNRDGLEETIDYNH